MILTRDGSRTLIGAGGAESYKSEAGALTEARHTFLEGSRVAERLRAGSAARVLEVGFGAGLLFLVTGTLALEAGADLDYVGLELLPPAPAELAALRYEELLAPSPLPGALLSWRASLGDEPLAGEYAFEFANVRLNLVVGDARSAEPKGGFHAVYHDAFSPRTAPELWEERFLASLAGRLLSGGRLVSFTVAGGVRRALSAAGLVVTKEPGPPNGKREVLRAERREPTTEPSAGDARGGKF